MGFGSIFHCRYNIFVAAHTLSPESSTISHNSKDKCEDHVTEQPQQHINTHTQREHIPCHCDYVRSNPFFCCCKNKDNFQMESICKEATHTHTQRFHFGVCGRGGFESVHGRAGKAGRLTERIDARVFSLT